MFVQKKYRSTGIGSNILNHLLEWLKQNKVKDIRLHVYSNNDIALKTYRKNGFKDYLSEMIYKPK